MPLLDYTSDPELPAEMQPSVDVAPITMAAADSWSVDVKLSDADETSDGSETTLVDGFIDWISDDELPSPLDIPVSTDRADFYHIGAQFDFEDTHNYTSYAVEYASSFEFNAHPAGFVLSVSDTEFDSFLVGEEDSDDDMSLSMSSGSTLVV